MRSFLVVLLAAGVLSGCGGFNGNSSSSSGGSNTSSGGTPTGGSGGTPSGGGGSTGGGASTLCSAMSTGVGASLGGFLPFPADNAWNQDISTASVDANSNAIISAIGASVGVHADFGAGLYNGSSIGIPYTIVDSSQSLVPINFTAYGSESDPGPMPIPGNAPVEGAPGNGDRHVLVLDKSNCFLYEMYSSFAGTGGQWNADQATLWDLTANEQRPYSWTSADAAGLPIFPGLARYDEVAAGQIKHALRFTLQQSRAAFLLPATHWASSNTGSTVGPMGMRMRLKSSFNVSSYSAANQVILNALKKYGMIMADNGSSMYISGAPDDRWDNNDLHALGNIKASDFEVVQMGTVYTSSNLPQGSAPSVSTLTATPATVSANGAVTLSWTVSGASYLIVSPEVGAVRGTSAIVNPSATTTYTLYTTNQYGRTTASVTVKVQ